MKMSFHSHADKTHFHMKSFARSLALKKRHKAIRKWPIVALKGLFIESQVRAILYRNTIWVKDFIQSEGFHSQSFNTNVKKTLHV